MRNDRSRTACHVLPRVHRVDHRQETRWSLALILLMGLATLSITATTQTLFSPSSASSLSYTQR